MKILRPISIYFCVLMFFSSITISYSQNAKIDSLLSALSTLDKDTVKVTILNKLSWEYHRVDVNKCLDYGTQALELSIDLSYKKGKARALNLMAIAASMSSDNAKAIKYNMEGLEIAEEINDPYLISVCCNDLGISLDEVGQKEEALKYYQRSLDIAKEIQDTLGIAFSLGNIGNLHLSMDNLELAKKYIRESVDIGELSGDPMVLGGAYGNMGYLSELEDDFQGALPHYEKMYRFSEKNGDKLTMAQAKIAQGFCNKKLGKKELSTIQYQQARTIAEELGDEHFLIVTSIYLSEAFSIQKKYSQSIELAKEGLAYSEQMKSLDKQVWAHHNLSTIYEDFGDFKSAHEHQKTYNKLKDSIYTSQKNKMIVELDTKYQIEKQQTENELLKVKNAKNEAILERQNTITFAIVTILLLLACLAAILFKLNTEKQAYNSQLQKLVSERTKELETSNAFLKRSNEELERFNYIASHDLKEPLRNIVSFTKLLEKKLGHHVDIRSKEYIDFVVNNATQMHHLIESVLEYSQIKNKKIIRKELNLNIVVNNVEIALSEFYKKNAVIIDRDKDLPVIQTSSIHLFIVLKNLIENGIKYNNQTTRLVRLNFKQEQDGLICSVRDNGIGIDEEYHEHIFEMFKRLHNRVEHQGAGLGLSICKKLIEQLGGKIWINKDYTDGTEVLFTLPHCLPTKEKNKEKALFHLN